MMTGPARSLPAAGPVRPDAGLVAALPGPPPPPRAATLLAAAVLVVAGFGVLAAHGPAGVLVAGGGVGGAGAPGVRAGPADAATASGGRAPVRVTLPAREPGARRIMTGGVQVGHALADHRNAGLRTCGMPRPTRTWGSPARSRARICVTCVTC